MSAPLDMETPARPDGPIARTLRNAGWLLGGKSVGGIFSLIYLGLAARALGLTEFGAFALILSFGQAVASIAQFQTAEVLIRFGARHLKDARHDRLAALLGFAAALDLASALACMALAAGAVLLIGDLVGLKAHDQWRAALFGASFLVSIRGAPVGVLRLLDRFDIAAFSETTLPASRLVAALACYVLAPSVDGFLIAWALAELATTIVLWIVALRLLKHRCAIGLPRLSLAGVEADNPGVWRFAWFTNFASSVGFIWQHAGTLAVGWGAGAAAAGGFRVAMQMAQSLSKPVVSLSRAAFPELTQIALAKGGKETARLAFRLGIVAAGAGLVAVALVAALGESMLTLVVGPEFAFAKNLLLLLTIAAAIEFSGFAQEPAMLAMGRPGAALVARAIVGLAYLALLVALLLQYGPVGAAVAAIVGRLVYRIVMTAMLHGGRK